MKETRERMCKERLRKEEAGEQKQLEDEPEELKQKETMNRTIREAKERKAREDEDARVVMTNVITKYANIDADKLTGMKNVFFEKKRKMQAEVEREEKRSKSAGGVKKATKGAGRSR